MKKILIPLLILISLTSCAVRADKGAFFAYQDSPSRITGRWTEQGCEYSVVLTLGNMTDDGRESALLEFTSPDSVKGTKYVFENGELTATLGDISVTVAPENRGRIFRIEKLFSLKSEDIINIKADKDGNTVAEGANWTVTTSTDGTPEKIEYDGEILEIEAFEALKKDTP